jgi:hypothetical protein
MIEVLSLFFILIAAAEFFVAYKIISKSDPFTFISLACIRFIFDFLLRPFTFTFLEKYEPIGSRDINHGLIHIADAPFYSLLTIILNDIAFFFVLLGAYIFLKKKDIKRPVVSNQSNTQYLYVGLIIFSIGLLCWFWVMQSSGGLINALISLGTGRQNLFRVGGSTVPFEIAKTFLSGGIFFISAFLFLKKKILLAWLSVLFLFLLLLTFGGRGLAIAAIISGLIAHNYLFKPIKIKSLVVLFLISLPLLVLLKDARRLLDGETELYDVDFVSVFDSKGQENLKTTLIDLSYVSHAFDYDMAFHYSYFERDKRYFLGEYPLGIGMLLPRTIFPEKGTTLANKLKEEIWCDGIGCKIDVGISPSLVTASAAYWTYLSFPIISFLVGYFGMYFWRLTVIQINTPLSLMAYSLAYPYAMTLFQDLNSFIASAAPIAFIVVFSYVLLNLPIKQAFQIAKK